LNLLGPPLGSEAIFEACPKNDIKKKKKKKKEKKGVFRGFKRESLA
jgi:hypothetical protein